MNTTTIIFQTPSFLVVTIPLEAHPTDNRYTQQKSHILGYVDDKMKQEMLTIIPVPSPVSP